MSEIQWKHVLAAAAGSYALGSLSPATAAARLLKADLRGTGSGNPGATNAARSMGKGVGVTVGVLDVAKGFAPTWYFGRYGQPYGEVAGLSAVLGHVTSPLLKGRGGKGVATSLGAILAVEPVWALPVLGAFGVTLKVTHRMGIGSVVGTLTLIPTSFLIWDGWAGVGFAGGLAVIVLVRHRRNVAAFVDARGSGRVSREPRPDWVDPGRSTEIPGSGDRDAESAGS
jgi:glycerol-3-phosphate acyltransferase PlsY